MHVTAERKIKGDLVSQRNIPASLNFLTHIQESDIKDLHLHFYKSLKKHLTHHDDNTIKQSLTITIFQFAVTTINNSSCRTLLESCLACFHHLLLDHTVISALQDFNQLVQRLFELLQCSLRLAPYLLPSIEKLLNYTQLMYDSEISCDSSVKSAAYISGGYSEKCACLASYLLRFSCSEQSEDLRLTSARSLRLTRQVVEMYEKVEEKGLLEDTLHQCLTSILRLLQDEDGLVRQEANTRIQFVNNNNASGNETTAVLCDTIQCNITLRNFIRFIGDHALKDVGYFKWLLASFVNHGELLEPVDGNKDECNLMLFEQEAANLYAEQILVIDLLYHYLKNILTGLSNTTDTLHIYSNLLTRVVQPQCTNNIDRLVTRYNKYCSSPVKKVYGVFAVRNVLIKTYKLLKCLDLLYTCGGVEERGVVGTYIDQLSSVMQQDCCHPLLKESYSYLVNKHSTIVGRILKFLIKNVKNN